MTSADGKRRILNFMGGQFVERWPEDERRAFFHKQELSYNDRINLGTFLYGNLRDSNLVYAALCEQLGADYEDHEHMRRWLADLASGKYDDKYYYYEVLHEPDFYFLNGARNLERAPPQRILRCLHAWEAACARVRRKKARWPSEP